MPSIAITRAYEAVYILDPDLSDEQIDTVTARYRSLVESQGGQVQKVDVWERRKLAYEVKGRTEGIYVIMHFTGTASVETELRRIFQISEDQIRSMIVRLEETTEAAEAAPAAQAASAPVAEAVPAPSVSDAVLMTEPVTEEKAEEDIPAAEPLEAAA